MEAYNLLVVSDLHLCGGVDPESGRFSRLEDFIFDDAFARFLRYHQAIKEQPRFGGRPWLLILNGDLFEFLQVVSLPQEGETLMAVKGVAHHRDLEADEQKHGLGTTAAESEWKLGQIARGHPVFFAALGWFLAHGNHIAIIKGNHDVELHWPNVRRRFIAEIERSYAERRQETGEGPPLAPEALAAQVRFYPWFYYEPGRVYIEHGGQYESSSHFLDFLNPVYPDDPAHLQMPWGSIFLRYLFNDLEDVHPFADNLKPPLRYFLWAFQRDSLMTIWLLVFRGGVFLYTFWKVARAALRRAAGGELPGLDEAAAPLPPDVARQIDALARKWAGGTRQEWTGMAALGGLTLVIFALLALTLVNLIRGSWLVMLAYLAGTGAVYLLRLFVKRRAPTFDDMLLRVARDLERTLGAAHPVRYIVLGHDHRAAMERLERAWYVNTGTWVLIFERKGPIEGRERLTFFRLAWGYEGAPELLCWDDAVGEPARLLLGLKD